MSSVGDEASDMESKRVSLDKIFSRERDYLFHTRRNLRDYSWEVEQVDELMSDLDEAISGGNLTVGELEALELNNIMIVPESDGVYSLEDGQQRLVTLSLVLAALRDEFSDRDLEEEAADIQFRLTPKQRRMLPVRRVEVRVRDSAQLRRILDGPNGEPEEAGKKSNSVAGERILANYGHLRKLLKPRQVSELERLLDFLLARVYLQVSTAPNAKMARRFVSNQRKGLNPEPVDEFKGMLFFVLADEAMADRYLERWEALQEAVGREDLGDACLYLAELALKKRCKRDLDTEHLEEYVKKCKMSTTELFEERVEPAARILHALRRSHYRELSVPTTYEAQNALDFLRQVSKESTTKALELVTLELCLRAQKDPDFQADVWLRRLERVALESAFVSQPVVKRYLRVFQMSEFDEEAGPWKLDQAEALFTELRDADLGAKAPGKKKATALLLRLDQHLQATEAQAKVVPGSLQLEHVLPQKATDAAWTATWTKPDIEANLHKLGNLALLNQKLNTKASNAGFNYKKSVAFSDSPFRLSQEISKSYDRWTIVEVKQRHNRLLELTSKVFDLQGLTLLP